MRVHVFLVVIATVLCGVTLHAEGASDVKIVTDDEFYVTGIEARTSNAREATPDAVIPKQWNEILRHGVLSRIPNRLDSSIIALYTDYESNENGPYTYVLGARVSAASKIPQGMVARRVPPGKYVVFTSDRGPVGQVVLSTWKRIWSLPQSNPQLRRKYKTDFELYDQRAVDPENSQIEIHVGIK
jgi:predicted transcriptional regulator YdeE